mmetsp:Transcript_30189/g.59782  ORF Transcript_30189/g.59782 Transcript_30189/m.59782 type:complete len:338 (+) Transcript_30189:1091-2104(+)
MIDINIMLGFRGLRVRGHVEFGFPDDFNRVVVVGVIIVRRRVRSGPLRDGGLDVRVQEGEAGIRFQVLARGVNRKNLRQQVRRPSQHPLKLQTSLLQIHVPAPREIIHDTCGDRRTGPRLCHQLHDRGHQVLARGGCIARPCRQGAHLRNDRLRVAGFRQIRIFPEDPGHGIGQDLGQRSGPVQHLDVHLHGAPSDGIVLVVPVAVPPLRDERHEVMGHVRAHQITANLEEGRDRLHVPAVVGGVPFRNLGDARREVVAQVAVARPAEELEEAVGDEAHVDRVGHAEQQVERFPLERLVRVLEALDDGHLVRGGVLGVVGHDGGETGDSNVFQIVVP